MKSIREDKVDLLTTRDLDLHGRRFTNAGTSKTDTDFVTRGELASPGLDFAAVKKWVDDLLRKAINGYSVFIGINSQLITIGGPTSSIGFYGTTPQAQQTLSAYTTNAQTIAYLGIATGVGGTPYAIVGDLNSVRLAYENLRLAHDDLRTKLQNLGLVV